MGGRFSLIASPIGALIIQAVNTGILLSGFPPEFNLIIKAVIILIILVLQSPTIRSMVIFLSPAPVSQAETEKQAVNQ